MMRVILASTKIRARHCTLLILALLCCPPIALGQEASGDPGVYSPRKATLDNILGNARAAVGKRDHAAAVVQFRQAAKLAADADANTRATIQYELGNAYRRLNQQADALGAYARGLSLPGTTPAALKSRLSNAQGISYRRLGRYGEAIDSFQQTIVLRNNSGNPLSLAKAQANLGSIYQLQGRYALALSAYREALTSAGKAEDASPALKVNLLMDIGLVLTELGDFGASLEEFEIALDLLEGTPDPAREGRLRHNMAFAYFRAGDVERAIEFYTRALALRRQAGDRRGEGKTLNNLGFAQAKLGRNELALKTLKEAVAIARERGDRATEGRTVDSIATVHMQTSRYQQALEQLQIALAIKRAVGDLGGEHVTLSNIGRVYLAQDRPSLAILFLKQSVNVTEKIRSELTTLPREMRQTYTETVAETYRLLADLLISEGRLPEAQQVLAMLKEEEYHEFIRRDAAAAGRQTRATYSALEQEQLTTLEAASRPLATLGEELRALERTKPMARTNEQRARIRELRAELDIAHRRFQATLDRILAAFDAIENSERRDELVLKQLDNDLRGLVDDLSEQTGQGVAVIHYVVLEERLHILLTTAELRLARQVAVGKATLNQEIQRLRSALQNPHQDPTTPARVLYEHLIGPIQADLEGAEVEHLMFYLDGALRYLPLAALYDGEHYLVERYSMSTYTAAAERNLKDPPQSDWYLAGLGLSQAHPGFKPLPAVRAELEGIVKQGEDDPDGVLAGIIRLDQAFTRQVLSESLQDGYPVLHLASHFVFRPGTETDSFLLLGDGSRLDLGGLRQGNYVFGDVDLLTLSACETAIGGQNADGLEVEGLATLTQKKGAKGVLATLWSVADASTGIFMQHFYRLLTGQELTKAEALRQTQLAFLSGDFEGGVYNIRGVIRVTSNGDAPEALPATDYRHPYYWAPFILMGNWL